MRYNMLSQIAQFIKAQRSRKRWHKAVSFLAAVVVFITTYALILPAITLEHGPDCGMEGHVHTDACYVDQNEDVESAADWEANLPTLTEDNDWAENLLRVAKSQLGFRESAVNYEIAEDGAEKQGYTRYGAWYGNPYGYWDAMFASFCLHYAEIPLEAFPHAGSGYAWTAKLKELELYRAAQDYTPQPGDIIFFDQDGDEQADRVGIVSEINPEDAYLTTIEGDNEDCVEYHDYAPDDSTILGYGSLALARERWARENGGEHPLEDEEPLAQEPEEPIVQEPEELPEPSPSAIEGYVYTLTASGKDYTVTVGYNGAAGIPENAVLAVREKLKGTPEYEERYLQAKEILTEKEFRNRRALIMKDYSVDVEEQYGLEFARVFDVEIQVDGVQIEPKTAVLVQFTFENESDASLGCVLHFADSGTELLDDGAVNIYAAEDGASVVEFQLESFSDIVVTPSPGAYAWFDPTNGGVTFYNGVSSGSRTRTSSTSGYATIPTPVSTTTYGYYLNGWLDITSGAYYDRGTDNFAKHDKVTGTSGVQIPVGTNNTVFYADWVATNYNVGLSSHGNRATPGNTSNFVKTHVFDYNELFNYRSLNLAQTATTSAHTETWSMPATPKAGSLNLVFTDSSSNSSTASISRLASATPPNAWTGATGSGYTGKIYGGLLTDPTYGAARRSALFDPVSEPGKNYLGMGDYLYLYNAANGYYYYDSSKNAASYNKADQRFYIYNNPVFVTNTNSTNRAFLPFNYASGTDSQRTFTRNNGTVNYFFGLSTEIDLYLPNAAGTGGNKDIKGQDMVFKFSGDDDIWVFLDDTLVLDLGGIHDILYGEINFSTGVARTAEQGAAVTTPNDTIGYGSGGVVTTTNIVNLLPAGEHKLTIYYLERGGNLSNYRAYFNIAPRFGLELSKKDADGIAAASPLLEGAQFSLYSDLACTIPVELWNSEAEKKSGAPPTNTFTVVNGKAVLWGLAVGQKYFLKETLSPEGYTPVESVIVELTLRNDGSMGTPVIHGGGSPTFLQNYQLDALTHKVSFDIRNKWSDFVDVTVGKTWLNEAGEPMTGTQNVTVNLWRSATKTEDGSLPADAVLAESGIILNAANSWSYTWEDLNSANPSPWHP